jgi:hypothetical protein
VSVTWESFRLGLTWALTKLFQEGWIKNTVLCWIVVFHDRIVRNDLYSKQCVMHQCWLVKQGAAQVRNMNLRTLYLKLLRTKAYKHSSFQPEVVMTIGMFLSAMLMKIQVFWDMIRCRLVKSPTSRRCSTQPRPWRWWHQAPPGTSVTTYRPIQCLIPEYYRIFTTV